MTTTPDEELLQLCSSMLLAADVLLKEHRRLLEDVRMGVKRRPERISQARRLCKEVDKALAEVRDGVAWWTEWLRQQREEAAPSVEQVH